MTNKKTVRGWAVVAFGALCKHEDTLSIYPTEKEAQKGMYKKGSVTTKCTGDTVTPCTITYYLAKSPKRSKIKA